MSAVSRYRAATREAAARRAALGQALTEAKARIAPARLKSDARDKVVQSLTQTGENMRARVREHPWATAAAGTALVAWLARRPIAALFRRLRVKGRTRRDGNSENDDG